MKYKEVKSGKGELVDVIPRCKYCKFQFKCGQEPHFNCEDFEEK